MAAVHGSKAVFTVQDAGSVVRDLSAYLSSSGIARSADTADVSTGGATSKKYIPGLKDGTIPVDGPFDLVVDGYLNGILGVERNFVYNPAGTGTGLPTYTGAAILNKYEPSSPVGDASTVSGEFQVTGDVTRAIQP